MLRSQEYQRRIDKEIIDTNNLLDKARIKYNNSVLCLKMEIEENKEFGNKPNANLGWVEWCNKDKARVKELENHLTKLNNMMEV